MSNGPWRFGLLVLVCIGLAFPVQAETVLTFDEVPFQPVDGLTVKDVTFDFKIDGTDSTEAFYHSFGPGTLDYIEDPSLTGDSTGILTMDFAAPTDVLQFAVALNTADDLTPGFTVELFDETLQSLGANSVDTTSVTGVIGFSEGVFAHSGTPVLRAVVDFADAPGSFALDNLTHNVPEPSALLLLSMGILAFLAYAWPRPRCR